MNQPVGLIPVAKPELGDQELRALSQVIESGWVTQGPRVAEFESVIADYCGARNAVAVSSCTTALHLSLVVGGVKEGDEVIVPSMSFIATAASVVHAGAIPIFAEVSPSTFNLDIDHVSELIGPRTRAIVLVHQLGLPADIDRFTDLATDHELALIEDAACAIGSRYKGLPIGSRGRFVCFSFHPRKVITTGDGGMILTDSDEDAERIRRLRQHGMSVSDTVRHSSSTAIHESFLEVGYNYRLTDLQAAVGIAQMGRLPEMLRIRRQLAGVYDSALRHWPGISTPVVPGFAEWNVQTYTVRLGCNSETRDKVIDIMRKDGIATKRGVMTAHREPAFSSADVSLPVSEAASDGSIMIPLFSDMSQSDQVRVVGSLVAAMQQAGLDPAAS